MSCTGYLIIARLQREAELEQFRRQCIELSKKIHAIGGKTFAH